MDRFIALKGADYVFRAARHIGEELMWNPEGRVVARARQVLAEARELLETVRREGMFAAVARGVFADVKRPETGGRGLQGVVERAPGYLNPILDELEKAG
jgi:beta-lysine 5,6-aminomutase alpha subunit